MKPVRVEELALRVERTFEILRLRMLQERRVGELEQLAATDELTGLGNRRKLMARVREEIARSSRYQRSLSAMMFDLDHFKRLNDEFGHVVGDEGLRTLGALLRDGVRDIDLVYRFGGEEFVVLLPDTDLAGAIEMAERLRLEVEACRLPEHSQCRMTASVGVTVYAVGESAADFLDRVDRAMYEAKMAGRNRVGSICPESMAWR